MTDATNPPGAADPASSDRPPASPVPPTYSAPPTHPTLPAYPGAQAVGPGQQPVFPPPVSAMPVSGYPTTGYPFPVPPPKVPTRKGPWLWVLVGVGTVLAAGIAALGYLVTTENAASQQTVAAHDAKVQNLEKDIRHKEHLIEVAEDDRDFYEQLLDEEQAVLTDLQEECPAAVQAYVDAAVAGDETAFEQAVTRMISVCHM